MAGFKVTTEVKAKAGDQVVFVELWDRGSGIALSVSLVLKQRIHRIVADYTMMRSMEGCEPSACDGPQS
jgi:hypothetical protein